MVVYATNENKIIRAHCFPATCELNVADQYLLIKTIDHVTISENIDELTASAIPSSVHLNCYQIDY